MTTDIKTMRYLSDAATAGPWEHIANGVDSETQTITHSYYDSGIGDLHETETCDAAFIAAAREFVPWACDELDDANNECDMLRAALTAATKEAQFFRSELDRANAHIDEMSAGAAR